ncbi:MAG: alcohol dehydrogenase catalytic domain-containing protein [Nitrososphaerota archaeon]|nr:alcohol dehydrogenase catalytic domain-containing protein [Candidatus Bathyarchaeota archaeon]MDW8048962.1 alcohol dehydrogenase catalytic domain-containing protein [Nitrososphaerota archaeon]
MKAVVKVKRGPGNVELMEKEVPKVGFDEVLIEVKYTGICGTDIHIYHDTAFYTPPVVLGHEYSGVIVEKGSGVKDYDVGDRVTSPATIPCGKCYMCRTNHANRCVGDKRVLGSHRADGTFAKYVNVPASILHKIPENLPFDEAAMVELVACVVRLVYERVCVQPGDTVAVVGPGPAGLVALQAAKAAGAGLVVVTGIRADKERLETARSLGADVTVNCDEEDPVESVKSLTDGLGVDVVLEASGAPSARRQAFQLVRKCGRVGLLGLGKPSEMDLDRIVEGELDVKGSWGTVWTSWRRSITLLSQGKIRLAPLITAKLHLEEWSEGFRMIEERRALKVLLAP